MCNTLYIRMPEFSDKTVLLLQIKGLTGVSLRMWIIPKPLSNGGTVAVPNGPVSVPTCRYVNLCLAPGCKLHSGMYDMCVGRE